MVRGARLAEGQGLRGQTIAAEVVDCPEWSTLIDTTGLFLIMNYKVLSPCLRPIHLRIGITVSVTVPSIFISTVISAPSCPLIFITTVEVIVRLPPNMGID